MKLSKGQALPHRDMASYAKALVRLKQSEKSLYPDEMLLQATWNGMARFSPEGVRLTLVHLAHANALAPERQVGQA